MWCSTSVAKFDPYKILGVRKSATADAIKARFRELAKKLHSDHGGDDDKFIEIRRAHDLLMDPQQRAAYDRYGLVDGDPESQHIYAAIATLKNMFCQVLAQASPEKLPEIDLIGTLRKNIEERRASLQVQLENMRGHRDRQHVTLGILKKRLKHVKVNTPNFFLDALQESLSVMPGQIAQLENEIRRGDDMLKILKDFTYDFEIRQAIPLRGTVMHCTTSSAYG